MPRKMRCVKAVVVVNVASAVAVDAVSALIAPIFVPTNPTA